MIFHHSLGESGLHQVAEYFVDQPQATCCYKITVELISYFLNNHLFVTQSCLNELNQTQGPHLFLDYLGAT